MVNPKQYSDLERQLILDKARLEARIAVFMQAMATLARRQVNSFGEHDADFARSVVKAADQAALNVRWEDLSIAKTQ
jgi:hypothetical protein